MDGAQTEDTRAARRSPIPLIIAAALGLALVIGLYVWVRPVLAGTAGGSAWAVLQASPLAVPIAVGVAAVVLGAKVAGDAFFGPPGGPG